MEMIGDDGKRIGFAQTSIAKQQKSKAERSQGEAELRLSKRCEKQIQAAEEW